MAAKKMTPKKKPVTRKKVVAKKKPVQKVEEPVTTTENIDNGVSETVVETKVETTVSQDFDTWWKERGIRLQDEGQSRRGMVMKAIAASGNGHTYQEFMSVQENNALFRSSTCSMEELCGLAFSFK